jgi:hypothetical protein
MFDDKGGSTNNSKGLGNNHYIACPDTNIPARLHSYVARLQQACAKSAFAWRWPVDIREATVHLFERQRAFRAELNRSSRREDRSLWMSGFDSLHQMFAAVGQPGTEAWSSGPFAGLPIDAFLIAYIFRHYQFAVERLLSFGYLAGAGFVQPAEESLDAAEVNLQEIEQMLLHLSAIN